MPAGKLDGVIVLYVYVRNLLGVLKKIHEPPVSIMLLGAHFRQDFVI
jgi:hypothetical protein